MPRVIDPNLLRRISEVEKKLKSHLKVPSSLTNLHPKAAQAKVVYAKYGKVEPGVNRCTRDDGSLDITTTPKLFDRALRILNTLIRALEELGHSIETEESGTYAVIGDDRFRFNIRERITRNFKVDASNWRSAIDTPSGELILKLFNSYRYYEWKDARKPIEFALSFFIAKIELNAEEARIKREEYERYAEIHRPRWEEEKKLAEELKLKLENEKNQLDELFKSVKRWRKAQDIRDFANAKAALANDTNTMDEATRDWLKWAIEKADWLDPNVLREIELLKDVRRERYDERDQTTFRW